MGSVSPDVRATEGCLISVVPLDESEKRRYCNLMKKCLCAGDI